MTVNTNFKSLEYQCLNTIVQSCKNNGKSSEEKIGRFLPETLLPILRVLERETIQTVTIASLHDFNFHLETLENFSIYTPLRTVLQLINNQWEAMSLDGVDGDVWKTAYVDDVDGNEKHPNTRSWIQVPKENSLAETLGYGSTRPTPAQTRILLNRI